MVGANVYIHTNTCGVKASKLKRNSVCVELFCLFEQRHPDKIKIELCYFYRNRVFVFVLSD